MDRVSPHATPSTRISLSWKVLSVGLLIITPLVWALWRGLSLDPHKMDSPLIGKPAPAFVLPGLMDGVPVALTSLRGKPTVLNFWSTWCVPCRNEHPVLVGASRAYSSKVNFVGVVYQDSQEAVLGWLDQFGGRAYPTLVDIGGKAAMAYGVYGVPETFVLDAQGVIRDKFVGPVAPGELEQTLEKLL